MGGRIQWPLHTREEMECLRAEWDKPDGFIEILPPQPQSSFGSGLLIGSVTATTICMLIVWLIS